MAARRLTVVLLAMGLLMIGTAGGAYGRTWRVEGDGSGDFVVIQDAVDAASDGDVIMIGPGRFDEYQSVGSPSYDVYVLIQDKNLALIGAGPDATFIGPEDVNHHPWPGPDVMIVLALNIPTLTISGICFEHSPWELISCPLGDGPLMIENCWFREGNYGVTGSFSNGGRIRNCDFRDLDESGVALYNPTIEFEVSACTFSNVYRPVGADWSPTHCDISDCVMDGGRTGVGFSDGATGSVTNCIFRNFENYGAACNECAEWYFSDNLIEQTTGWGLFLGDANSATIRQNIISTESGTCLFLVYPCDGMVFDQNHMFRGDGDFAKTNDYWPYEPTYFHLENNYWGTTDLAEISEHIIDGYDNEDSHMYVIFEPILDGPVQTESTTWGAVKTLFR